MSKYKLFQFLLATILILLVSCADDTASPTNPSPPLPPQKNITVSFLLGNNPLEIKTHLGNMIFSSNIAVPYGQNVGTYLDNFVTDTATKLTADLPNGASLSPALSSITGSSLTNTQNFTVTHNGNNYPYQLKLTYQVAPKPTISANFKLGNNIMVVATNGSTPIFSSNITVPYGQNVGTYLDNFVTDTATKLTADLPNGASLSPALSSVSGSSLTNTQNFTITHNGNNYPYKVELAYIYCGAEAYQNKDYPTARTEVAYSGKIYENKWHANAGEKPETNNVWEFVRNCSTSSNLNNGSTAPTTYCGVEAYQNKDYPTSLTEVFYQNKIYENQWYANANDKPGTASVWKFVKDCNSGTNTGVTSPKTYCGAEAYQNKDYPTKDTEVFYQNKIYENQWYANASDKPGTASVWKFVKDCNNP